MEHLRTSQLPKELLMQKMLADLLDVHQKFLARSEELVKIVRSPGPQGSQGSKGEKPTKAELHEIIQTHLPTFTEEYLTKLIKPLIPKVKDGKTPIPGIDFKLPRDGKDASTDPLAILDALAKLPKGKKLSAKHIDGLEQTLSALSNQTRRGYLHGAGITSLTAGENIVITPDGNGGYTISSTGGAGLTVLPATGTINNVNVTFSFTLKPSFIVVNGQWLRENFGWSWSTPNATLSGPVGAGGDIYGIA